ncbi:Pex11p KNAG_0K02650 [Huiozyma naganishii CBS 8797]|uniref:Peroxisomal biogenesis factor 11 n=1 Tax=Huiozyma naganishii (strain ATCC MYA-139 / BCRC 22969 / CBS 8797 / KCTC 17520 / NBRC 10181 / NCYC 3082 / Yp74L-3) TaxID=1071383 RepID=J7RRX1_HUIN7|nr:hypothetical protein KNAG_0K02650 [Kazachstania naganishii CBS 8797]CCK72628.1 hypothetical protein KNAG_0K02650 [Kazachstania naganishii CBS 8797]
MVCDSVVYHPTVTRLVQFLDTTAGREKLLRLLQYLCRFLASRGSLGPGKYLAKTLQLQFTMVRKLLRFAKPLNHLQLAAKFYDARLDADSAVRALQVAKNLMFAVYLTLDQVNLLRILKIVPTTQLTGNKVPRWANWFWLLALVNGLLLDVRNLQVSLAKLAQLKGAETSEKQAEANGQPTEEAAARTFQAVAKQKFAATRRLVWDAADTFIVLNNLGYLHSNDGSIGLAGVFTSFLGLQDLWK